MIDRRAFLIASANATALSAAPAFALAASPDRYIIRTLDPFASPTIDFAHRIEASTAGRVSVAILTHDTRIGSLIPQDDSDIVFGSLDVLTDLHPGFAFFAGLPGKLGLPSGDFSHWIATSSSETWRALQDETGLTCLPVGTTWRGADLWSNQRIMAISALSAQSIPCAGLTAKILTGIGVKTSISSTSAIHANAPPTHRTAITAGLDPLEDRKFCARNAIARQGSTLAIIMRRAAWDRMPSATRTTFQIAARDSARRYQPGSFSRGSIVYRMEGAITDACDRVSEAIVAELSNHDALTRRINASYFATRRHLLDSP